MTDTGNEVPDRNLAMELARVTEAAALAASRWVGQGDKDGADGAAVDAMRIVLSTVPMDGIVVIGEGEKDEAPMLYNGEAIGDGSPPATDIAVDPIDGTTLTSLGRGNALAVIAVSERGTMYNPGPCVYMEKIAVGPEAVGSIDISKSPAENLAAVAAAKGESIRDLTVVILDRDRHTELITDVREAGRPDQADSRRRRRRRDQHRMARLGRRHPHGDRRHPRGGHQRGGAQVHGRRDPGAAVAAQHDRT